MATKAIQATYVAITGILSAPNPDSYPMTDQCSRAIGTPWWRVRAFQGPFLHPPFSRLPCLQPHFFSYGAICAPARNYEWFGPMRVAVRDSELSQHTLHDKKIRFSLKLRALSLQLTSIMCSTSPVSLSYRRALLIRANRLLSRGFCLRSSAL